MERISDPLALLQRIERGELRGAIALKALAETGSFVFHGSSRRLEELEPRQALNNGEPDGRPAVFAAPDEGYELAVFMALVAPGGRSSFSTQGARDGRWDFTADQKAISYAKHPETEGFVHVFWKRDFTQDTQFQYRCERNIRPLLVVRVARDDIPQGIAQSG